MVQKEEGRNAAEEYDRHKNDHKPPRRNAELDSIEHVERHPCPDVDEAAAVEHKVYHRREDLFFHLRIEVSVPADRGSCCIAKSVNQP